VIGGHEPCGVVAERGPGVTEAEAPIGQRVMQHHYKGCGLCKHCRTGWSQLCPHGIVVYGMTGHGGPRAVHESARLHLVPLPDAISFEEGAAISCGTGTAYGRCAGSTLRPRHPRGVRPRAGGAERHHAGRRHGARVIAVDIAPERLKLARDFGARAVINSKETDPVAALKQLTHGEGVDRRWTAPACRRAGGRGAEHAHLGPGLLRGRGRAGDARREPDMLARQLTIIASWTFNTVGQAECARFIADKKVPLKRLLTHRYTLDEAAAAYTLFDTQTTGKGVFVF
jgi:threonine dehydrogenase-like Zn-dependent dehydrogenase